MTPLTAIEMLKQASRIDRAELAHLRASRRYWRGNAVVAWLGVALLVFGWWVRR